MNYWKTSTIALTVMLGVVAGGSFVKPAAATPAAPPDSADSALLTSALDHLKAAKVALKDAETRTRRVHRLAIIATDAAMRAVEVELQHGAPKDPGGGAPKDPPGGAPKDPPGGGAPKAP